jgi:hypothetical protein
MKTILLLVCGLFLSSQISFAKEANGITSVKYTEVENFESTSNDFKNSNVTKITVVERHRIWLNLTNSGGAFKQLLLGYMTGATNGWDNTYDGVSLDSNQYIDFYSVNGGKNLTIQARALPFQVTDEVPLGYKATIAGTYQISIDHVDGLFLNQNIFLKDTSTGVIHNLKNGSYSFSTLVGRFNDRFVLLYIDSTPQELIASEVIEPTVIDPIVVIIPEPEVVAPIVTVPEVPAVIVPEPEVTEPIVTVPEAPVVIVPEPEVTDPIVTVPEAPVVIVPEPEVVAPIVTIPEAPVVIVPEPEVTAPAVTVPEAPVVTVPEPEVVAPIVTIPEAPVVIVPEPEVIVPVITNTIVDNGKSNKGKDKSVVVFVNNDQITINSVEDSISDVFVFNMGQKQLFEKRNVNTTEFVISNLNAKKQVLIIKTQLKNGNWTTSKVVL